MKTMTRTPFLAIAALGAMIALPGAAQERKVGPGLYAVTVHRAQLHPATPAAARRTIARIEAAALEACGASPFSLREVKLAVRSSDCWGDSVAATIKRLDDPLLLSAYRHES
jgi:UrcA family protein